MQQCLMVHPTSADCGLLAMSLLLQGAPYAYTPFCDTNKETEPYR